MRLFIVSQSFTPNRGSFSRFVELLAKHAHKKGYDVIILGAKRTGQPLEEKLSYAKIIRFETPNSPLFANVVEAFMLAYRYSKFLAQQNITTKDIIVANGEAALGIRNYDFVLRVGDQPMPVFLNNLKLVKVSLLSDIARTIHFKLLGMIEKKYINHAKKMIFSSRESRLLYYDHYSLKDAPYFIPRSSVQNVRSTIKRKQQILFVSSTSDVYRKGAPYLKRVLPELFVKFPNLKLVHVGGYYDWGERKDRVEMPGRVSWEKMQEYYYSSQVYVSCSVAEGIPNTILEAMVAGTPVVASDIEGIYEYIGHKKEGFVYERENVQGLLEGILFILDQPEEANKIGRAAQKKVKPLHEDNYYNELMVFIKDLEKNINLLE